VDSDDYVELPPKCERNDYEIMRIVCYSLENEALREDFLHAVRGRGAFRYLRDVIRRRELYDAWDTFRRSALHEIAVEWIGENGVPFALNWGRPALQLKQSEASNLGKGALEGLDRLVYVLLSVGAHQDEPHARVHASVQQCQVELGGQLRIADDSHLLG
jgi:hypothetical protein